PRWAITNGRFADPGGSVIPRSCRNCRKLIGPDYALTQQLSHAEARVVLDYREVGRNPPQGPDLVLPCEHGHIPDSKGSSWKPSTLPPSFSHSCCSDNSARSGRKATDPVWWSPSSSSSCSRGAGSCSRTPSTIRCSPRSTRSSSLPSCSAWARSSLCG